jgi:hypothetical protein
MIYFALGFIVFTVGLVFGQVGEVPQTETLGQIFQEAVGLFTNWKGLSYQYKIAGVLFILVGTAKNSVLAPHWEKLPKAIKPWVAPVLSLVAFLFMVQPFTLETALAAVATGAAAGYAAQLLDLIKMIPGVGPVIRTVIDVVGVVLKRPTK